MKYIPTIGMEVHAELKTDSKMFCACKNELGLDRIPNTNICPICTGQPGALPAANERAIEFVVRSGLALGCKIAKISKFDRKNYFYPDLPKGYQISQYDQPLCRGGKLEVGNGRTIGITRIHLEEDTGKLIHQKGNDYSLVDFNRSGVPLMELVTEPDIESAAEAKKFCEELQLILRYIGISDADMEKGQMRCEANVSISADPKKMGTKVEVKNLNSFKVVEKAIEYEIKRQSGLLDEGKAVVQETRGWDEGKMATYSQREKESAHDYRYFPEPDLPPLEISEGYVEKLRDELPELPAAKAKRFVEEYKISDYDAGILTRDKKLAEFFEQSVSEAYSRGKDNKKIAKLTANYIITDLRRYFSETAKISSSKESLSPSQSPSPSPSPENFGELIYLIDSGKLNSAAVKVVLEEMVKTDASPEHIISEKNLVQLEDEGEIGNIIQKIVADNPGPVGDYKTGKQNALQYLVGQVMKQTRGRVNPQKAAELLKKYLV